MTNSARRRPVPAIIVSDRDHKRLVGLATTALDYMPRVADRLLSEMDQAKVVAADKVPSHVVQIGSVVEFRSSDGQLRRVTLVLPGEADVAQGRISILTPIGAALIGLSRGQAAKWTTRDGREHELLVLSVSQALAH